MIAFATTIVACKKESLFTSTDENPALKEVAFPANPMNPYDIAGQIHNQAMDTISADVDFIKNSLLNRDDVNDKVSQYLRQYENCIIPNSFFSIKNNDEYLSIIDSKNLSLLLTTKYRWSTKATKYASELFVILQTQNDEYKICDAIIQMENNILKDNFLSQQEKDILLTTASVSRYSVHWWTTQYTGPLSKPNGWSADAKGAIAGGLTGAIIGGSVTVGAGTVPGWVAGAISGGLSNSIVAMLDYFA